MDPEYAGVRLDIYLASVIEDASRSFIKKIIKSNDVLVNGKLCVKPGRLMAEGDRVRITLPRLPTVALEAEDIPLDVVFEDDDVVVVNKPSGMVVHPAPGHYTGTLVHALLYLCPGFGSLAEDSDPLRPGIVHRLDQFTSGLLVVAKNPFSFGELSRQAREHRFGRTYFALVQGDVVENRGRISASIGRSVRDRKRMTVTGVQSREAVTRFSVKERFGVASLLELKLETGRTHQIRVHLRFAGYPVLGDTTYGIVNFDHWNVSEEIRTSLGKLEGQALHAAHLSFLHPRSKKDLAFSAPLPHDFAQAMDALRSLK